MFLLPFGRDSCLSIRLNLKPVAMNNKEYCI